jgi:uncharacterized protein
MIKIRTLLTTTVLLFGISGSGIADFNDGWKAYQAKDYATAIKEWRSSAEEGHYKAQYQLGDMYYSGEGVLKNKERSFEWYKKSADQSYALAQFNLGLMYDSGEGVLKDNKEAVKWFRRAAKQGLSFAQYELGWKYSNGIVVLKDKDKAIEWYKKSAEQGFDYAQIRLGEIYTKSPKKDLKKAKYWIHKAYNNSTVSVAAKKLSKAIWSHYELWKY